MPKIIFSAFADEYSQNFDEQIEVLLNNNISLIELRNIDGKGLADFSFEEIQEFKNKLDKAHIKVSAIGSPLGKIDITDDFDAHLEKAEKIFKIANIFKTNRVRIFSFYNRTNFSFDTFEKEVLSRLRSLINLAAKYGITLCHENEALIYGESYKSVKKLLDHFNEKLKAVFDMGNYVLDGNDPIEAYNATNDYILYCHIKDSLPEGAVVPAGKGKAHIKDILSMYLSEYKKDVIATIEPHLETFDGLNGLAGKSFINPYKFKDAKEAFLMGVKCSKKEIE